MLEELVAFFSKLGYGNYILLLAVFIVFIYAITKTIKFLAKAGLVAIASLIFPFAMNLLGWPLPLDPESLVSFVLIGLSLFFFYILAKGVYHILSVGEKVLTPTFRSLKKKEKDLEKIIKDNKKRKGD